MALLLLQRSCSSKPANIKPHTVTTITVEYDTILDTIPEYIPKWRDRIETQIDTFTQPIDTLSILKDYYAKNIYVDTINVDTIGYVVVSDTLTRNSILSRNVMSSFSIPITTITTTNYINNRELYLGVDLGGTPSEFTYVGGKLMFRAKNNTAYSLGVGLNRDFQPIISGGMFWKIGK